MKSFSAIQEQLLNCQYPQTWRLREQLRSVGPRAEDMALLLEDAALLEQELPFHS